MSRQVHLAKNQFTSLELREELVRELQDQSRSPNRAQQRFVVEARKRLLKLQFLFQFHSPVFSKGASLAMNYSGQQLIVLDQALKENEIDHATVTFSIPGFSVSSEFKLQLALFRRTNVRSKLKLEL